MIGRDAAPPMRPGMLLSQRYRVEAKLGEGGMGEIYQADDVRLGRKVALKMLPAEFASVEDRMRRFALEARAASALNHPNILTIYEIEEAEGRHFIVSEFVDGNTIRELLSTGPVDTDTLLRVAPQVADALAAAHGAGIVHRDIKPENIMVRRDGYVKLLDFGLAKLTEPLSGEGVAAGQALTLAGLVVGTLQYMSPEQAAGRGVDHRTDIFSLGCVLYEMATGGAAFAGESFIEVLQKIAAASPPPVGEVNPLVPPELVQVIEKCLAREPRERYQHADELAVDLRRLKRERDTGLQARRRVAPPRRRRHRAIRSLAILPLVNAGADSETEYLSDGITEVIINDLAQLPNLRVMAWSGVLRYKGQDVDPLAVGQALKVDAILTGRVRQRGETLDISTELVDAAEGWQLWGGLYHRTLSDIAALQTEIASEIAGKLRLRVAGRQKQRLAKPHTVSAQAYQDYLKGRYHWNQRTEEGLKKGLEFFQRAVEHDPRYAQAYAGLADSYILLGEFGILPMEEALSRAGAAAQKALEIDGAIAEAHTSLGKILEDEYDWSGAGRAYRRAIELNPSYATGRHWHARYLAKVGRLDEAVEEIKRAQGLDPLSLVVGAVVGEILFFARRYDEAMEEFRQTLEIDPHFSFGHLGVGLVHLQRGRYEEAIGALQQAVAHSEGSPPNVAHLGLAYARAGRRVEAMKTVEELKDQPRRYFQLAEIYAALGDQDKAFDLLERAYAHRSIWMRYLKVDPGLDNLRSDPRFLDLMGRMRFPP